MSTSTDTFAAEIEECANEPILSVVISARKDGDDWHHWDEGEPPTYANKMIDWQTARPILDYHYDDGYGGQGCHSIYAWTEHWIVVVREYDGSTTLARIPRNPIDCVPQSL